MGGSPRAGGVDVRAITNPKSQRRWWRRFPAMWADIVASEAQVLHMRASGVVVLDMHPCAHKRSCLDWTPEALAAYNAAKRPGWWTPEELAAYRAARNP